MAVRLRLARTGKKKQPHYRIVAADARVPRDGRFLEILGWYDPRNDPSSFHVDLEAARKWLSQGATASERVAKLLALAEAPAAAPAAHGARRSSAAGRGRQDAAAATEAGDAPVTETASPDALVALDEPPVDEPPVDEAPVAEVVADELPADEVADTASDRDQVEAEPTLETAPVLEPPGDEEEPES